MTLKNAALLALIGMILATILMLVDFLQVASGVLNDVVAPMALVRSLLFLLASLGVTAFFYVFYRTSSR